MTEIRVLAVRQPWASLIIEGLKIWEMRTKPTNIRQRIAIYASTHEPTSIEKSDYQYTLNLLRNQGRQIPKIADECITGLRGCIIGSVVLKDCFRVSSTDQVYHIHYHYAMPEYFEKEYVWKLENPIKFSSPIPYKPPKGAIVWSKTELPEGML